jgi:endonuclease III
VVAAILADGAHPVQVNRYLAWLQEHCATPAALGALDHRRLEPRLRPLPMYHGGTVPGDPEALLRVPGLGPAGAALVADAAFGIPRIIADRAVLRVARRLGWGADRASVESAIAHRWPAPRWPLRSRQLAAVADRWCRPIRPKCAACPLRGSCPAAASSSPALDNG